MSDSPLCWFHCGRCGTLFQSPAGESATRLCTKCGFDPCTGILESADAPPAASPAVIPEPRRRTGEGKRSVRKRRNRHLMLKLAAGWSLVLALIVLGARKLWYQDVAPGPAIVRADTAGPLVSELDIQLLERAGPGCAKVFSAFLQAGTPEERNQFVLTPVTTASRMARFYSLNPITNLDPAKLQLKTKAVIRLPGGKGIETQWLGEDERLYDAVFREENGEWRLDWEHFARFSDYPWALFLAGSGESEGEFRLLARERLAEERKNEETISVVFYSPRFGHPGQTGFQSPEFLVSRRTPEGRMLDAGFKFAREGGKVFGSTLPDINPEGMIRVRARIKRIEVEMERRFELTGIAACHWYAVDDPGVSVPEPENTQGEEGMPR